MERQLIDVLEKANGPEDIDEVSKAMIAARVTSAVLEVRTVTAEYLEKIRQISAEKELELNIAGFTLVLNVTDSLLEVDEPTQLCVYGPKNKVRYNMLQLLEKTHG